MFTYLSTVLEAVVRLLRYEQDSTDTIFGNVEVPSRFQMTSQHYVGLRSENTLYS